MYRNYQRSTRGNCEPKRPSRRRLQTQPQLRYVLIFFVFFQRCEEGSITRVSRTQQTAPLRFLTRYCCLLMVVLHYCDNRVLPSWALFTCCPIAAAAPRHLLQYRTVGSPDTATGRCSSNLTCDAPNNGLDSRYGCTLIISLASTQPGTRVSVFNFFSHSWIERQGLGEEGNTSPPKSPEQREAAVAAKTR